MASSVASGGMRMTMAERVEQAVRWDRWDDWASFLSIRNPLNLRRRQFSLAKKESARIRLVG
jgi:hypothetical protein